MSTIIFITINIIFSYLILLGGIFLTKFFTDKFECRKPYKTAVLVNIIWFLITFFGIFNNLIIVYLNIIGVDINLIIFINIIVSVVMLLINFIVITLLIKVFYKSGFKDSIFISLAVISIQVFMRIIVANVLSIIFGLTTGGVSSFYIFQFI